MIAGIVIGSMVAYLAGWLYAARWLYGHWRARGVDRNRKDFSFTCPNAAAAVREWDKTDRPFVMFGAVVTALVWPAALLVIPAGRAVAGFLDATPVLSRVEMQERIAARDRRIAELEREAGIRP